MQFMRPMQRPLADNRSGNLLNYENVRMALDDAGWQLCVSGSKAGSEPMLKIVQPDTTDFPDRNRHIVAMAFDGGEGNRDVDFTFALKAGVNDLAPLFRSWMPPDVEPLDRLLSLFGANEFLPLVKGLHRELVAATDGDRLGAVNAHRLAGLSGTLGFSALSESWRAMDAGGEDGQRLWRESRKVTVAIAHWLDGGA
ncbi:MAG: hypothetical protein DI606_08300 [Sphingobium sp.]|nr:MAG: hypothetical protein DI606_08300 [Sphingobium sp.]